MKNAAPVIEKVLSALNNTETPPEMEQRILATLRNHESHSAPSSWLRPPWRIAHARAIATSIVCGLAALIAALLIPPAMRRASRAPARPTQNAASISQPPLITTAVATIHTPAISVLARKISAHPARKVHPGNAEESLAEAEMRAPSLPTPPMPLTEQEQLLLRIVHANDPVELASLDSKTWAAQFAQSKARFDKFFAPPKTDLTGDTQ